MCYILYIVLRASWKISLLAKCCHPHKIKSLLTYLLTRTQQMEGRAHPSPFTALSFPDSKKVPVYCWVDRENLKVVEWLRQVSISRPFGDVLLHNRASLMIQLRCFSDADGMAVRLLLSDLGLHCLLRNECPSTENFYGSLRKFIRNNE